MINFTQLNNDVIKQEVRNAFVHSMTPSIEKGELSQEQANYYFKTLFESADLVDMIRQSLLDSDFRTVFRGVEYTTTDVEVIPDSPSEFLSREVHSFYDDLVIFIQNEYEPRDCATYFTFIFKPHENINHTL